jgi:hypothetical protein
MNRLPPVPSIHHVVDRSGMLNSELPSHDPKPRLSRLAGSLKPPHPSVVEKLCSDPDWGIAAHSVIQIEL